MKEANLGRLVQLAASELGWRLFRNNVGVAYVGDVDWKKTTRRTIVINNWRAIRHGLCVGSSDHIGWTDCGKFVAVEEKVNGRSATPQQKKFLQMVNVFGGIGWVVESVEQFLELAHGRNKTQGFK